jgi:hypothetical protein
MMLSTQNNTRNLLLLHALQAATGCRLKVVADVYCSLASSCRWHKKKQAYVLEGNPEQGNAE